MIATDYREKLSLINTTRESFTDCMLIDENTPNKPLTWRIIMHWLTEITLDNRELSQYHAYAHVFTFCKYNYSFFFCTFSAPNFAIMVQGMSLTQHPPPSNAMHPTHMYVSAYLRTNLYNYETVRNSIEHFYSIN